MQSPLKKKVEAFERHANERKSPAPLPPRTTRTKTRTKQNATTAPETVEVVDTETTAQPLRPSRSVVAAIGSKFNTPIGVTKQPIKIPHSAAAGYGGTSGIPTPTSKLAHISRSANKVSSLQREQSAEDLKRGLQVG